MRATKRIKAIVLNVNGILIDPGVYSTAVVFKKHKEYRQKKTNEITKELCDSGAHFVIETIQHMNVL